MYCIIYFLIFQTLETDGASAATSFEIDGSLYLFVTNMGNFNRYRTMSRLYRVDMGGVLTVVGIANPLLHRLFLDHDIISIFKQH